MLNELIGEVETLKLQNLRQCTIHIICFLRNDVLSFSEVFIYDIFFFEKKSEILYSRHLFLVDTFFRDRRCPNIEPWGKPNSVFQSTECFVVNYCELLPTVSNAFCRSINTPQVKRWFSSADEIISLRQLMARLIKCLFRKPNWKFKRKFFSFRKLVCRICVIFS